MKSINYDDLEKAIQQALLPGHRVAMIHSSIGMFGSMDNLVENCINAWIELAKRRGYTIAMPTFTWSFCKTRMYHHINTPAETGILPERFRRMKGVIRGKHPIFSFAAYGPLAEEFVSHEGETCWGKNTPFDYLKNHDGLLIMFGVGWEYLTFYHYIEEVKSVPYHYFKVFRGKADYGQGLIDVAPKYHVRSLELPTENDFSLIHKTLEKQGKMITIKLGDGNIRVLRAGDVYDLGCKLVDQDPYIFLKDIQKYIDKKAEPLFVFFGSGNLDVITDEFEKNFYEKTHSRCRTMKIPFGQYKQQILDRESDLQLEKPNYIVFSERIEEILGERLNDSQDCFPPNKEIDRCLTGYIELIKQARELLSGVFLVNNFYPLDNIHIYQQSQRKKLVDYANTILRQELEHLSDTFVLPYDDAVASIGKNNAVPGKYWYIGRIPFSLELTKQICDYILGAYLFLEGKTIRLVITDLDNTLWGGIIGEDGISGLQLGSDYPGNCFIRYQKLLKTWSKQGKVLAIVSRNTEAIAFEAIEKHPDMILRKDDFAFLKINWNHKVDNIREISRESNLGLSSICLIDDSPFERQQVRDRLPEVFVPEMPKDVAEWTEFLSRLPQFEVLSLTEEDRKKSERYKNKAAFEHEREKFASLDDFYKTLEMKLHFKAFSPINENRVLQLLAKTNQFNTTTRRYKKSDLEALIRQNSVIVPIGLEDCLSAFEIIGLIILRFPSDKHDEMSIDVFLLSCRVLGRNLEQGILSWITQFAQKKRIEKIRAEIIPTERNIPAQDIYSKYGFVTEQTNMYSFELKSGVIPMPDYFRIYDEINS